MTTCQCPLEFDSNTEASVEPTQAQRGTPVRISCPVTPKSLALTQQPGHPARNEQPDVPGTTANMCFITFSGAQKVAEGGAQ